MNGGKIKKLKGSTKGKSSSGALILIGRKIKNPKNIGLNILVAILSCAIGYLIGGIWGALIGLIISLLSLKLIGPTLKEIWK